MPDSSVPLIIASVSAIGAAGAAVAAWRSAAATSKAAESALLLQFLKDYARPEMRDSLRVLRNWKDTHGHLAAERWHTLHKASDPEAKEVDSARRRVTLFFKSALVLYRAEYVTKRFMDQICGLDGIVVLLEVGESLEYKLNSDYDKSAFDALRTLVGPSRGGLTIPPVPPGGPVS